MSSARLHFTTIYKRMFDVTEAADYCGMATKHFKALCPVVPVALANRIERFDKRDLDQWIDNVKTGAADTSQAAILGRLE
jgi:hypothetical protein